MEIFGDSLSLLLSTTRSFQTVLHRPRKPEKPLSINAPGLFLFLAIPGRPVRSEITLQ